VDCARYIINLAGKYTISDLNKEITVELAGRKYENVPEYGDVLFRD